MSSNESEAYKIMVSLDVDYVLVIFGGVIGYSGDDINKFLWMVRIAEGEHPKDIRVSVDTLPNLLNLTRHQSVVVLILLHVLIKMNFSLNSPLTPK
jgi:asparagine N-glycosylation enzyme membrane subunit Stt3